MAGTVFPLAPTPARLSEAAVSLTRDDGATPGVPPSHPRTFRVVLVREGLSKNGNYFTRRAVEDVAHLAEGTRAFADHPTPTEDRERPVRSVRDVVGFYEHAGAAVDPDTNLLQAEATLRVFESAAWLAVIAAEALSAAPAHELIGLSIDSVALMAPGRPPGTDHDCMVVDRVIELKSVDVVTRPSAGGAFVQIQESEQTKEPMEVMTSTAPQTAHERPNTPTAADTPALTDLTTALREAQAVAEQVLAKIDERDLAFECKQTLADRTSRSPLPAPVLKRVRQQWSYTPGRWSTADDYASQLDAAIALEVETLGELRDLLVTAPEGDERDSAAAGGTVTSPVTGMGGGRVQVVAESEKQLLIAQIAMDKLFDLDGAGDDPDWQRAAQLGLVPGLPRWSGIREAYARITGDHAVSGLVFPEASIVREANEVTTGVLNHALLNSMSKRLVRDYRGQEQSWRKFVTVTPLANFKSQDRVRLHDFSSLSTVAEGGTYANLAWDDSREAYAPAKRGNLVVVTREAIMNDDLRAIRRIPQKLARAAHITINEFVYGLFTGNPAMADGTKVFDDGVQTAHGNRGTSVLSSTALQAAITSMMKQTDTASKRLNLKPRYLLVPADLLFTALTIVNSTMIPGSANNDANVLKGAVEPIPVAQFTDATDWYLVCDPQDIESLEVGFVGGKQEPELLMQEAPLLGQVFTNDQMSFKVRWEFGGAWLDYRGTFWSQAAG